MAKETKLTDEEIFVEETTDDSVGIWTAKPLSLKNTVLLARLLGGVLAKLALRSDQVFDANEDITEDGVMKLLSILNPPLFRELLCVITGATSKEVEDTYTLKHAIAVIIEFWQQEDLSNILGEARRLAANQEFNERTAG